MELPTNLSSRSIVSSSSNLSISTLRPHEKSTPRTSISISLKSPLPDGRFMTDPSEGDQDEIQIQAARNILAEVDDPRELRDALENVLAIADKLSESISVLRASYQKLQSTNRQLQQTQTELETSLVLEKSNLALERANNEMLEEALKREGGNKDIGWKRWSDREGLKRSQTPDFKRNASQTGILSTSSEVDEEGRTRRRSTSIGSSGGGGVTSAAVSPTVSQTPSTPPVLAETSRFFKFRFGGGVNTARDSVNKVPLPMTPSTRSPVVPTSANGAAAQNHLTSASLPSLVPAGTTPTPASRPPSPPMSKATFNNLAMELELLKAQHNALQRAHNDLQTTHTSLSGSHRSLADEKKALDEEIETLSQALFEEANKMVADERKRCAVYEEELETCRAEKEALKGALRVVEEENGRYREKVVDSEDDDDEDSLHAVKSRSPSPQTTDTMEDNEPHEVMYELPPAEDLVPIPITNLDRGRSPPARTGTPSRRPAAYHPVYI